MATSFSGGGSCLFFEIRILIDPLVSANSSIGALEVCYLQINYQIEKI
jgi:hypothetical protein